ncbi:hypothetical protein OGAPHI_002444 [Ogataea philodendri]|uniref:Uncharacterized protein n=1 Tax=Ogataea philodendri TaxID=1378263 RepID=A0A9P8T805_9ASCO|nr:uncharacterized protein OGAPHI_002444 [Ogataea philodendri]KAH3668690.1 hypothetical protein OGAPHI_002444 [Ogataea philodendri]
MFLGRGGGASLGGGVIFGGGGAPVNGPAPVPKLIPGGAAITGAVGAAGAVDTGADGAFSLFSCVPSKRCLLASGSTYPSASPVKSFIIMSSSLSCLAVSSKSALQSLAICPMFPHREQTKDCAKFCLPKLGHSYRLCPFSPQFKQTFSSETRSVPFKIASCFSWSLLCSFWPSGALIAFLMISPQSFMAFWILSSVSAVIRQCKSSSILFWSVLTNAEFRPSLTDPLPLIPILAPLFS